MDAWRMHRVGAGETLATIGKRYGVTPANIVSANRMESAQAQEGDRLLIPAVQRIAMAPPAVAKTATARKTTTATAARRKSTAKRTATAAVRPVRRGTAKGALVARNGGN
jgi:spore germination protein YaaH